MAKDDSDLIENLIVQVDFAIWEYVRKFEREPDTEETVRIAVKTVLDGLKREQAFAAKREDKKNG